MSIWMHPQIKATVDTDQYITEGEGQTPVEKITIVGKSITLKREDQNPTGSYKDRGSAYKITLLKSQGIAEAVIASSGNAAISFLTYANQSGIKMNVVLSDNVNKAKLALITELIQNTPHELHIASKARTKAAQIAGERKIPNLRAPIDPVMPIAYRSIAYELTEQYSDIFVTTSSGTALLGIHQGLATNNTAMHACQNTRVNPIANLFDHDFTAEETTLADAIVDKAALRSEQIQQVIKDTRGFGWVLSNSEIEEAYQAANAQLQQPISYNSALAIAGFIKAVKQGKAGNNVLCIASGR